MKKGKFLLAASLLACNLSIAAPALNPHHFFIRMYNATADDVTISFRKGDGNVELDPILADNTTLSPHFATEPFGVNIVPLDPAATFNIVFKHEKECTFNIGFYAPGRPRVTMQGPGCLGGGSRIVEEGTTLVIYISGINKKG